MPRLIFGILREGQQFYQDVVQYCAITGQPRRPRIELEIFQECTSQILAKFSPDVSDFMYNLMELPCWTTINYLSDRPPPEKTEQFCAALRVFGLSLWTTMHQRIDVAQYSYYQLESVTPQHLVVIPYLNANYA